MQYHAQTSALLLAVLLGLSALCGGCTDADFEELYEIKKLRVIGIAATPPDVASGETVEFEAITATPDGFGDVFYRWQICVFTDGPDKFYRCSDQSIADDSGDDLPISNILAEGSGETFTFEQNLLSPDDLVQACVLLAQAQESISLPDFVQLPVCEQGLPVYVRVEACAGEEPPCADPEVAFRRYSFLLESIAVRDDRDTNPPVSGLLVNDREVVEGEVPSFMANADREVRLTALVSTEASQDYLPIDRFNANTQMVEFQEEGKGELLRMSWFVTEGGVDRFGFYSPDGRAPIEELQSNVLSFDKDDFDGPKQVHIWLVLRDGRSGVSYIERRFEVQPFAER